MFVRCLCNSCQLYHASLPLYPCFKIAVCLGIELIRKKLPDKLTDNAYIARNKYNGRKILMGYSPMSGCPFRKVLLAWTNL